MNDKLFSENEYWFPAKRYGWGWGFPITWQGWAVFILYFVLFILARRIFPPDEAMVQYIAAVLLLSSALIFVCWYKGEPARWRWGGEDLY